MQRKIKDNERKKDNEREGLLIEKVRGNQSVVQNLFVHIVLLKETAKYSSQGVWTQHYLLYTSYNKLYKVHFKSLLKQV